MSSDDSNDIKTFRTVGPSHLMMRRVLRSGEFFVCGICRTHHATSVGAGTCLQTCWKPLIDRAPWVIEVRGFGKQQFACSYCKRGYPNSQQAHACALDCVNKMAPASANGRVEPRQRIQRAFKKTISKSNFQSSVGSMIARRKLIDTRFESDGNQKPITDDSAAVCSVCNAKYPTKAEADACFATHDKVETQTAPS